MKVIESPQEMQNWSRAQSRAGLRIGLVPTMGYLHEGHLSLVRKARELCDTVIVSIFVNPIQFGEGEDYDRYPRDLSRDLDLLRKEGVDAVFTPTVRSMYPEKEQTMVEPPPGMENKLCGRNRPGHFRGVTTVVSKLFNICLPDMAFFGQKDAQQALIIEKMVKDLNFPVQIVKGEIIREPDGLAMSSRNVYLSPEDREKATILYRSLLMARDLINRGEREPSKVREAMLEMINQVDGAQVDYVEIYNASDLSELEEIKGQVLLALAVRFGTTRLIDNLLVEV